MTKKTHTTFTRGKRLRVRLKRGEVFVDYFEESNDRFMTFRERGKVAIAEIKNATVYKAQRTPPPGAP